jgi:hypothetical protein
MNRIVNYELAFSLGGRDDFTIGMRIIVLKGIGPQVHSPKQCNQADY